LFVPSLIGLIYNKKRLESNAHRQRQYSPCQNKLSEALVCYNKAISLDPNYALALCNRDLAFEQVGKHIEVVADLKRAEDLVKIEDDPTLHLHI